MNTRVGHRVREAFNPLGGHVLEQGWLHPILHLLGCAQAHGFTELAFQTLRQPCFNT